MNTILELFLKNIQLQQGSSHDFKVYYQVFGPPLGKVPIVLVNHPLTGNSNITGDKGWWKKLIGQHQLIDTTHYTVLAFNIPGNAFPRTSLVENHQKFSLLDIAKVFLLALDVLEITKLFAIIGGSIGGALAWQMAALRPNLTTHLIPIAADYKATDWLLGICKVQDTILANSQYPVEDARKHAMLYYRTPASLQQKFNREKEGNTRGYKIHSWLDYHGISLNKRYPLQAYRLVNHLLSTIDISQGENNFTEIAAGIFSTIHIITIPTDNLFLADENWKAYVALKPLKENIYIYELKSIHGHDAFLLEYEQLKNLLRPIFKNKKHHETNSHHLVWDR